MPPLKTYKFENIMNSSISIIIDAYSFERAYEKLTIVAKYPADFKFISCL